ncbi:MAG: replication initiator protein A [Eubacterium sp.]|nr:replication initiator protein A [Eubacterium sp.]
MKMKFITASTGLPTYMVFPRFLMQLDINHTSQIVYMLLMDRTRMSQRNPEWIDENGHVFVIYTIRDMANRIGKSPMTVKNAYKDLEEHGLILRCHTETGRPNHIYLQMPETVFCPEQRQNSVCNADRKLSPNKNNREITTESYHAHGQSFEALYDQEG